METIRKNAHGGARKGAGRKALTPEQKYGKLAKENLEAKILQLQESALVHEQAASRIRKQSDRTTWQNRKIEILLNIVDKSIDLLDILETQDGADNWVRDFIRMKLEKSTSRKETIARNKRLGLTKNKPEFASRLTHRHNVVKQLFGDEFMITKSALYCTKSSNKVSDVWKLNYLDDTVTFYGVIHVKFGMIKATKKSHISFTPADAIHKETTRPTRKVTENLCYDDAILAIKSRFRTSTSNIGKPRRRVIQIGNEQLLADMHEGNVDTTWRPEYAGGQLTHQEKMQLYGKSTSLLSEDYRKLDQIDRQKEEDGEAIDLSNFIK